MKSDDAEILAPFACQNLAGTAPGRRLSHSHRTPGSTIVPEKFSVITKNGGFPQSAWSILTFLKLIVPPEIQGLGLKKKTI